MRILDKNKAIATVAGLLLGLGFIAWLGLGSAVCDMPLSSTCAGVIFFPALGIIVLGAFAIATSTGKTLETVGAIHMGIIFFAIGIVCYSIATGSGGRGDGLGFALVGDMLFIFPITLVSAWLGTRVRRWRGADSM
jgi:hypothetical protein